MELATSYYSQASLNGSSPAGAAAQVAPGQGPQTPATIGAAFSGNLSADHLSVLAVVALFGAALLLLHWGE